MRHCALRVAMQFIYMICHCACASWCRHKCRTQKHTNSISKTNIRRMHCLQSCSLLLLRSLCATCRKHCISVSSNLIFVLNDLQPVFIVLYRNVQLVLGWVTVSRWVKHCSI